MNKDSKSPAKTASRIKLALRRVSVRTLNDSELTQVAGGTISVDTEHDPTGCNRSITIGPDLPYRFR